MSFALVALPSAISTIAQLDKKGLRQAMGLFTAVLLLPRLAYSYDLAQGGLLIKSLNNINSRSSSYVLFCVGGYHPTTPTILTIFVS